MLIQKFVTGMIFKSMHWNDSPAKRGKIIDKMIEKKIIPAKIKDELAKDVDLPTLFMLEQSANQPKFWDMTIPQARAAYVQASALFAGKALDSVAIEDTTVQVAEGVTSPLRVYTPSNAKDGKWMLFYPGGGFVIGDVNTHHTFCTELAQATGAVIFSIDYRKGPEVNFPLGHLDCIEAWKQLCSSAKDRNLDPSKGFVGGDSAGGNLAAMLSLQALHHDDVPTPAGQLLIYPATSTENADSESYANYGVGLGLSSELMAWFFGTYFGDIDMDNPPAELLEQAKQFFPAGQNLKSIAPAVVINAKYDPLLSDGQAYAKQLKDEGALVSHRIFDGLIHNFINMGGTFKSARLGINETLKEAANLVKQHGNG